MERARVYYRFVRPAQSAGAKEPWHPDDSQSGFSETSILRFVHDPDHHCEVISVPTKSRDEIDRLLKQRFPDGSVVIESISWLT
jgi:hypothetical protein